MGTKARPPGKVRVAPQVRQWEAARARQLARRRDDHGTPRRRRSEITVRDQAQAAMRPGQEGASDG